MRHFASAIDIAAPPDHVWSVMRDVTRWPEWTSTVHSIRQLDAGPLAVGVRALVRQPKLLPAVWRVIELTEGRAFTWITRGPGVTVIARHGVTPAGDGARADLSLEFTGPLGGLVGWLTRRINTSYLEIEAAGLKRRCEGPEPC
jgi:uncharacterized membrane protein